MYKNKYGFSLKVFLIRGQNSICRNAKPTSRTTPIKKSVGNINKKFSLCFSLNIFQRDFESIPLFICHGLWKKTLRLPLSYSENRIFAGKKLFSWQLFAKTSFIFTVDFVSSSVTLHTAWSDVIIIPQCILETIIHRGSFI